VILGEIDDRLKQVLTGPDRERDRMIFWLYFRQGMSTKEIASLPAIALSTKGVGSVIERVKQCIREQITGPASNFENKEQEVKSKFPRELVMGLYGALE